MNAFALRQEGRYGKAAVMLRAARDELTRLGIMFSAAEVSLRIVETELPAGSPYNVLPVCEEAVAFFRDAGLPKQAQKAADYLLKAARIERLTVEIVQDVCAFLTRLRDAPEELFRRANEAFAYLLTAATGLRRVRVS